MLQGNRLLGSVIKSGGAIDGKARSPNWEKKLKFEGKLGEEGFSEIAVSGEIVRDRPT